MYIRQRWKDLRLAHHNTNNNDLLLTMELDKIWAPDLFIKNEKVLQQVDSTTSNTYVRIDRDGNVVYSHRVSSTVSCFMDLRHYPFDDQVCSVQMESCK